MKKGLLAHIKIDLTKQQQKKIDQAFDDAREQNRIKSAMLAIQPVHRMGFADVAILRMECGKDIVNVLRKWGMKGH